MRDTRLTGLDFLRALACLLVFAHHTTQRLDFEALTGGWVKYYLFFNMGAFGVAIFFLLSGFLLARPFWLAYDSGAPMPSLATYALRRAARIVPGYYLALTVTVIVAAALVRRCPDRAEDLVVALCSSGLLFVGEFHWLTLFPAEVNGPLWSIGMEVACYALLPFGLLALFALRRQLPGGRGRLVFAGVVGLALVAQALIVALVPKSTDQADFAYGMIGGAKYWMPQYNVAGFFAVFALGSLVAGLSALWRGIRPASLADVPARWRDSSWRGCAMWSVAPMLKPEAFGWLGIPYDFPFFHLGVALALLALPHSRLLPAVTELAPIRYIAKVSFGLYIWHFLILELARRFVEPHFAFGGIANPGHWLMLTGICFALALDRREDAVLVRDRRTADELGPAARAPPPPGFSGRRLSAKFACLICANRMQPNPFFQPAFLYGAVP